MEKEPFNESLEGLPWVHMPTQPIYW